MILGVWVYHISCLLKAHISKKEKSVIMVHPQNIENDIPKPIYCERFKF